MPNLKIRRTLTVPNGSDPDLYKPGVPPVRRMSNTDKQFNVLWIGSAYVAWHNFKLLSDAAKETGGLTGSVFYDLTVPDFTKEKFNMSGVVLTAATAQVTPTAEPDPILKPTLPGPPTTRISRKRRGSTPRFWNHRGSGAAIWRATESRTARQASKRRRAGR